MIKINYIDDNTFCSKEGGLGKSLADQEIGKCFCRVDYKIKPMMMMNLIMFRVMMMLMMTKVKMFRVIIGMVLKPN